jgi:hypothetical protein
MSNSFTPALKGILLDAGCELQRQGKGAILLEQLTIEPGERIILWDIDNPN